MVLKPRICGVKKEIGGPKGPMMLMMLALGGPAGHLKGAINRNKRFKMHAVGSVCGCKN